MPRPRVHLIRYHGAYAPNCLLRRLVVPSPQGTAARKRQLSKARQSPSSPAPPVLNDDGQPVAPMTWAVPSDRQSRRVFEFDITACPECGGRLRWIAGGPPRMSLIPR